LIFLYREKVADATLSPQMQNIPMLSRKTRTYSPSVFVVAMVIVLSAFAQPASAAGKTATFCKDVAGVGIILSPALPSNDSASAIASAVSKLPSDVSALKKIHVKLIAAAATAPSPTLARVLRIAATSVLEESTALASVMNDEAAVLANPKSSSVVMTLARDLIVAISAAATANAYLAVDQSTIAKAC
jgi:hypothetical protein